MNVEKVIILFNDHQSSYDIHRCEDRNRNYVLAFGKNCTEAGLNIPKSNIFLLVGCTHLFPLFYRELLLLIIVCKICKLIFSVAVEFFTCTLLKEH
jgi:hypothetical protein